MRRRRLAALAAIPLALVLAGCAPHSGTVHAKQYTPSHYIESCFYSGKAIICTPIFVDAEWCLDLYTAQGDHGWRCVSERQYDAARVGLYFTEGKN